MRWSAATDIVTADRIPRYISGFGAALALVVLGEILLLIATGSSYVTDGAFLIGVITPLLCGSVDTPGVTDTSYTSDDLR